MKITALVENQSSGEMKPKHGLALYIETAHHKLLFDVGPDGTLVENAAKAGVDLAAVDTVILSHGHFDHGGGLKDFLTVNHTAKVYAHRDAFAAHYNKVAFVKINIGLSPKLMTHPQMVLLDGDTQIDNELSLFTVSNTGKCHSPANDVLLEQGGKDSFRHEQNLLIGGEKPVLIMGCGHTGVVNILEKAGQAPAVCVGGYHLFNPVTKKTVPTQLLAQIAAELARYPDTAFYTCHCTGPAAYAYLQNRLPNMHYLSCGDTLEI